MTCWRKRTCVAPVLYAKRVCASLPFLAAERRVHQDHVEQRRSIGEEPVIHDLAGQRVAVPDVRPVDAVQDEVGERDRVDQVLLLPSPERLLAKLPQQLRGRVGAEPLAHMLECLGEEAAGAAAGVVDRLADRRVDGAHHRPDDFARREELTAVVVLLAHLEQQALVGLAQGEEMCLVDRVDADLVDSIEDVEEVLLCIDAYFVDRADDLADHALAGGRSRGIAKVAKMGEQLTVDEGEVRAHRGVGQLGPLRAARRGPVAPSERCLERGSERDPERGRLLGLDLFALVEDPQEEDPRQLRHVLEGPRVVRASHHVRDLLDRGVHRRGSGQPAGARHRERSSAGSVPTIASSSSRATWMASSASPSSGAGESGG